ncbi:uncharacterized protein LOC113316289 [Papaver somniferum]|uniref:uncharacterized protein LOC113316289 n=1 Tax=Papaver somniferum TaxID=3469 RepID=UPI000E6FF491|nr:uncharacterized protein LOC113316289 [Papaver somniferum]
MEAPPAATETPTTITSLSLNDTTQENVQKVPSESRFPLVDEGDDQVGVPLSENDEDAHAIIANTLPKSVIIQSNIDNLYLHFEKENPWVPNAIRFHGDYSFGLETRFEVVQATTVTGLVHIRCLRNNKYWANSGTSYRWVTAMAIKPEENQSDPYCTLFKPIFEYSNNNRVVKLRHVNTGYYVRRFYGGDHYYGALYLSASGDSCERYTFIDWESVVMLPDLIRIKGDNGNHLESYGGDGYMDYNRKADNSSFFDYEVSPSRDGGIRLKGVYHGKYWTDVDTSIWVLLKEAATTFHDTNTVFLPTIVDGNRIIMRSLKNGKFCNRFTTEEKTSCLATLEKYPDQWSSMEIEEPVMSRKINNVRYHLTDARLYNEKILALITDDSSNYTQSPLTSSLNLKTTVTNTTNWSNSVTMKVGIKMTCTAGVPGVSSGAIEISADITGSQSWGETHTETQEVGSVKTITVPPMTRVKGSLMATRVSYDIPFAYTQHDVLKNGSPKVYEKNDGVFTGHNGYGYKYEVVNLPLQ